MPDLKDLLEKTSRTFALSIPPLPEPTAREVTIAYLLFRIADTFEDASHWTKEARVAALADFERLLTGAGREEAVRLARAWSAAGVATHAGYRELIEEVPFVLDAFRALQPGAAAPIGAHVARSARGMAGFVSKTDGDRLRLSSLEELREYCYAVAGIVGEMLTELFLLGRPALAPEAPYLRERAASFGEALQLVNILKDAASDAKEGRTYLPPDVPLADVFAAARRDLLVAGEYIAALQRAGAPRGILEFTTLPVELAWASLEKIETKGPGAKISRPEVFQIVQRVRRALERGDRVPAPR